MTKDDIIRMTVEASGTGGCDELTGDAIERFHNLAVIAERESLISALETANARSKMRLPDIIVLILSRSQS